MFGGGGGGGSEINNADNYYNNLNNQGTQLFNLSFAQLQQLMPLLWNTLNGQPTNLSEAAMAPVGVETENALNTINNNLGGTTSPQALYQNLVSGGQQQAALSTDAMLTQVMNTLAALTQGSMNQGSVNETNAAGGEANIGTNLSAQNNNMWGNIFGAIGSAIGHGGGGGGNPSTGTNIAPVTTTPQGITPSTLNPVGIDQSSNGSGIMPSGGTNDGTGGTSTPVTGSSNPYPWLQNTLPPP